MMRNVFDQYEQRENRLTHALTTALAEDRALLHRFVRWASPRRISRGTSLDIIEQGLPGEPVVLRKEEECSGLPDACISDGDRWALVIESKVAAVLDRNQLRRHLRTVSRRGFRQLELLILDTDAAAAPLLHGATHRRWSEVYAWLLGESRRSQWAGRVAEYLQVAENHWVQEGYLTEGTLTTFAGIPFGTSEPYNYPEAKRVLRLAMEQLRERKDLRRTLGMDHRGVGRGAITGRDASSVWDYLPLKGLKRNEPFTRQSHLTLYINDERLGAIVTIPHGVRPMLRGNLVELGMDGFRDLLERVNRGLMRALRGAKGGAPWVEIVQRRYPSQRAVPIYDARIEFDLRTAFPSELAGSRVRPQPQWLKATYDALSRKRSNLQVAVGAVFPYRNCPATRQAKILDAVAGVWLACSPLIRVMQGRGEPGR